MAPRNQAVLAYLQTERVAEPETNGPWVKDGYSLATHPDLCERVEQLNEAAGSLAELKYLYGKPALITGDRGRLPCRRTSDSTRSPR